MKEDTDTLVPLGLPVFLDNAEEIMRWMKTLSFEESRKLWDCNEKIAELNVQRLAVFEESQYEYIQKHLRILSGFYGILKPMDGVTPYRLEMQSKAEIAGKRKMKRCD